MAVRTWISARLSKPVPAAIAAPDHYPAADVAVMLRELGIALVGVAEPVQLVEQRLRGIAARYTTEPVQVAVLPTMVFIQVGSAMFQMQTAAAGRAYFDTAAGVDRIAELAAAGAITPQDAVAAVRAARTAPRRFGPALTMAGYALTTVGFGLTVQPSWTAVLPHLFLGLVVGLIVAVSARVPTLAPIVPTLSAVVVTLLATWFVADVARDGLLRVISPALIATLPGMALVIGAIELAGGRIVAGSSRTVYALAQLGLLVYGVVLAVHVGGSVPQQLSSSTIGPWSVYVAILVIAVGLYLYLSAPPGSLPWLVLVIAVAVLVQKAAALVLGTAHAGFVAAMVAIPTALLASRIRSAPPAGVLGLAAFWSLVPGQLTFMSLSRGATGDYLGIAGLGVAAAAIASIALGTLVGWTLVRSVTSRQTGHPPGPNAQQ